MSHDVFEELLAADTLGALSDQDRAHLAAHRAAGCGHCDELSRSFASVMKALPSSIAPLAVPLEIKTKLMASLPAAAKPSATFGTGEIWKFALAAMLLVGLLFPMLNNKSGALGALEEVQGTVLLNGIGVVTGSPVRAGQHIVTMAGSSAELHLSEKVLVKVQPESDLLVRSMGNGYELTLKQGGVINMVKTGTPYVVMASFLKTEARGTVFTTRVENPQTVYVCICQGHIDLSSGGSRMELMAAQHRAVLVSKTDSGFQSTPSSLLYHSEAEGQALSSHWH